MLDSQKALFHRIATILSLVIIIGGISLIIYLGKLTADNNAIIAEYRHDIGSNNVNITKPAVTPTPIEAIPSLEEKLNTETLDIESIDSFEMALNQTNNELFEGIEIPVQNIIKEQYAEDLLAAQPDIIEAIENQNLDIETMGALFLPHLPAQYSLETIEPNTQQLNVPLILQKDPKWGKMHYGSNGTRTLAENGCAIVSLAMVDAFLSGKEITPQDVLDWAGQDYYVHNQGTSWQIFYDYALDHGLTFLNHGANFATAMNAVAEGEIVIASVEPGYFTEVGHILVIRGYEDGYVWVNDPNDDPEKMFSVQPIDEQVFLAEGVNYWSYTQ